MARKHKLVELEHYVKRLDPNDDTDASLIQRVVRQAFEMDTTRRTQCGCGKHITPMNSFRCVYCGQFLCVQCAEVHFGLTREEYDKL